MSPIPTSLPVTRWLLRDAARKYFVPAGAQGAFFRSLISSSHKSLNWLMKAHRFTPRAEWAKQIQGRLKEDPAILGPLMPNDVTPEWAATRSLVLKAPKITEDGILPGVFLVKFTDTFRFFFHRVDRRAFLRCFHVVLEPSWAGYAIPEILFWLDTPGTVVVQSSEQTDRDFISGLNSHLIPVPFGSSDWVNHRVFRPTNECVDFDAVYVANYAPLKRVHILFRSLRKLARRGEPFRAALVCSRWGGERETVHKLIEHYGVADRVEVFEALKREQVNSVLNRSKCNLLLSLKEGSNRSLFEAMFADTPVILLAENRGVNREYINERTGYVVPEANLPEALLHMAESFQEFKPRAWAMENISPEVTTRKLSRTLQKACPTDEGYDDLPIKTNDPEAVYFDADLNLDGRAIARRVLEAFDPERIRVVGDVRRMRWLNGILEQGTGSSEGDLPLGLEEG